MEPTRIAVYGAGGFAREVAWLIDSCNERTPRYDVVGFIDDNDATHGTRLNGLPVMGLERLRERFPDARLVAGIGSPKAREHVVQRATDAGFEFETIIHPRCERSRYIEIGDGAVICAGNILTTNIRLGRQVQINLDCTIGHDVVMGDFATLAPGVHVSGWVHMGRRVYVGTGAVMINGTSDSPLVLEDDVVVGAGACVTQSVAAGSTVVGVPAKPIAKR